MIISRRPAAMRMFTAPLFVLPVALAACVPVPLPGSAASVTTPLYRADDAQIGTVVMTQGTGGAMLQISAAGLPPGRHGVHLHAVGQCGRNGDFSTAGEHWNPTSRAHGHDNPAGHHLGDLGNIEVGADGKVTASLIASGARMDGAAGGNGPIIADVDGATLLIHADADDERSDPSGNSGARIACAVLAEPAGTTAPAG
jgi:Cu-Zn family superoxide dismutase